MHPRDQVRALLGQGTFNIRMKTKPNKIILEFRTDKQARQAAAFHNLKWGQKVYALATAVAETEGYRRPMFERHRRSAHFILSLLGHAEDSK